VRRELSIALFARVTWVVAALGALLVGHGFVLAVDLFSASSRSAIANALEAREMDPLAGIVRPTLGGLDLALVLLGPLVAARTLSLEKERGTYGALCLMQRWPARVVVQKGVAALAAVALLFVAPVILFAGYAAMGGHLDIWETAVAFAGEVLRALLVVGASLAAAAWTRSLAAAVTIAIAVSLTSWAIDAAEGFAALAWLGGASAWSIERALAPFARGIVPVGASLWLLAAAAGGVGLACVGGSFESASRKAGLGLAVLAGAAVVMASSVRVRRAHDWTEQRRASLPPAVVADLRRIAGPIDLDVYLDRDDSRRRQLESDVLAKLTLARPDVTIRTPLDTADDAIEAKRDVGYGRVLVRAGGGQRETRSTSRREIVTLVFEASGRTLPEWNQPPYPGYPEVVEGPRRAALMFVAYALLPLVFLILGFWVSQRRIAR
jgi:hypothetical protein